MPNFKETQKEDFKKFKENFQKLELLFIIMKWDMLLILRIHKLLQKKSILEKADNVNRGDRDKKAQPSRKSTLTDGGEIDPIWDTLIESIKT